MSDLIEEKNEKPAIQRQRSPGYPQIGLQKCIELAKRIYEGAHTGEIDSATLIGLMGYSAVSGQGLSAASALKKFGLIEGRGEKLKVTALALKILEPMSTEERQEAVKEAAMKPELYSEVLTRFGGKTPSDEVMRSFLIRNYEFAPTGADNFIKAFKETTDSIERTALTTEAPLNAPPAEELNKAHATLASPEISSPVNPTPETLPSGERLTFRISQSARVHVIFEGEITSSAIEKLIKFLELSKDSYADIIWD
jgi:hypothetical protein